MLSISNHAWNLSVSELKMVKYKKPGIFVFIAKKRTELKQILNLVNSSLSYFSWANFYLGPLPKVDSNDYILYTHSSWCSFACCFKIWQIECMFPGEFYFLTALVPQFRSVLFQITRVNWTSTLRGAVINLNVTP